MNKYSFKFRENFNIFFITAQKGRILRIENLNGKDKDPGLNVVFCRIFLQCYPTNLRNINCFSIESRFKYLQCSYADL